jgi:hypothetical protein
MNIAFLAEGVKEFVHILNDWKFKKNVEGSRVY